MDFGYGECTGPVLEMNRTHRRQRSEGLWFEAGLGVYGKLHDMICSQPRNQIARRAERDDLAVVHDGHTVAETLRFLHIVGREQDGSATSLESANDVPQLSARLRIESGGWFV